MKVLVAGGAGYIGSHMVRTLIAHKHTPVVFDNLSTGHKEFIPRGVSFVKGDLRDFSQIKKAFEKYRIDAVMHFAASALVGESVENPLKYYDNNVLACIQLLKVMKEKKVRYFIFSSTCAVYGQPKEVPITETSQTNPINSYGQSKLMIEKILSDLAKRKVLSYVALRYFNACGAHPSGEVGERHYPETHLIPNVLKVASGRQKELMLFGDDYDTPDGTCVRDYVHLEDLCSAHLLALNFLKKKNESQLFNLGTEKGYSVKEILEASQAVVGKKIKYKICPRRPGDPATLIANSNKAKKILKWKSKKSLKEIIESAWRWELKESNNCS